MKIEAIYEAQMTKNGNKVVVPITLRCKKCGDYNDRIIFKGVLI